MKLIKYLFCSLILIGSISDALGQQTKEIHVSRGRQKVPDGKVWYLSNQKAGKILFPRGAFRSGTPCYASLFSNPRYIFGISYYDVFAPESRPKTVGFTFSHIEETFGSDVHLIKPHFLLLSETEGEDIAQSLSWKYQPMEIVFYPGTVVFTSSCIDEIMLLERDMTRADKAEYEKRVAQMEQDKKIKEQRALEYKREAEEKKLKADQEKFDDPNTLYMTHELDNLNALKFDSLKQEEILNSIINLIKSQEKTAFGQYSGRQMQISVEWDSLGKATEILVYRKKTPSSHFYPPTEEFKIPEEHLEKLRSLLTLNVAPEVVVGGRKRKCPVKSYLVSFSYSKGDETYFSFRIRKDTPQLSVTNQETSKMLEEELKSRDYLSHPQKRWRYMFYYRTKYTLILESRFFQSPYEETARSGLVIFPYSS